MNGHITYHLWVAVSSPIKWKLRQLVVSKLCPSGPICLPRVPQGSIGKESIHSDVPGLPAPPPLCVLNIVPWNKISFGWKSILQFKVSNCWALSTFPATKSLTHNNPSECHREALPSGAGEGRDATQLAGPGGQGKEDLSQTLKDKLGQQEQGGMAFWAMATSSTWWGSVEKARTGLGHWSQRMVPGSTAQHGLEFVSNAGAQAPP